MNEGVFKKSDLRICDWQYSIRHEKVNNFVIGETVFLKSNPEHPMSVHLINEDNITTIWKTKTNKIEVCEFPPESILQYSYAGLLIYKEKYNICLN